MPTDPAQVSLAKQRARDLDPALATLGIPFAEVHAVKDMVVLRLTPGEAGDLLHQLDKLRPR
jgi:sporulation protein YlmC with PRC-barrel domain